MQQQNIYFFRFIYFRYYINTKIQNIWTKNNLNHKDFKNLNSFNWFFSLDLKSSKKISQTVIKNWINNNHYRWFFCRYKKHLTIVKYSVENFF